MIAIHNLFPATVELRDTCAGLGIKTLYFQGDEEGRRLLAANPDVAFVLDINFHADIQAVCAASGTRYVSWSFDSQDHHKLEQSGYAALRPDQDFLFFFNQRDYRECGEFFPNVYYLPFAAAETFEREPRTDHFAFDALIVMISYSSARRAAEERFAALSERASDPVQKQHLELAKALLELTVESHLPILDRNEFRQRLDSYIHQCGVDPFNASSKVKLCDDYGQLLSSAQRAECARSLIAAGVRLDVYGDAFWDAFLAPYPSATFHGQSEYAALPELYNQAKVNVNLTQIQNLDSAPQRVFHVLAAGGFLLTNASTAVTDLFKPGVDLDVFHDFNELRDKVRYYLSHEDERLRISQTGHQTFLAKHRMRHRFQTILSILDNAPETPPHPPQE